MARCACGNATCSCVITGGDGITIVGNGSPTRPYEIAIDNALGALPDVLKVVDTATVDLTAYGQGTVSDPMSIYANANVRMTDLIDVADPEGGPQTGEVPIWQASGHWEFRPLPSGPPTTVQTANGITGDGSAGTPVSFRNSGTWDTTWQAIFGPTNTNQTFSYVDSNGQVRVPGTLIDGGATNRLAADMMDKYPNGVSLVALSTAQASAGLWPGSGSVLTTKRNSTQGTQLWMNLVTVANNLPPQIRYRFNDGVAWSPWFDIYIDTGWVDITPASGTGTLQYRYLNGVVSIRGNLSGMTSVAPGAAGSITTAAAVPAAYIPSVTLYQMGNGTGNTATQVVLNAGTGTLTFYNQSSIAVTVARFTMTYLKE